MAYVTGTANDISALRTAIFNACMANGWTLSGDILHKDAVYTRLQEVSGALTILGGTGKDGGNNLTTPGPRVSRIANDFDTSINLTFPLTYHVHINTSPDEVYVYVNYLTDVYQWLAWGQSSILLPGTGVWYGATAANAAPYLSAISIGPDFIGGAGFGNPSAMLFWSDPTSNASSDTTCFIHHRLDGDSWSGTASIFSAAGKASAFSATSPLHKISPNNYNGEALLLPLPVVIGRPSSLYSLVAQPKHARIIRIDNHSPEQTLTIGGDQWRVYPCLRKNSSVRNGGQQVFHSGTFGMAIRHTP